MNRRPVLSGTRGADGPLKRAAMYDGDSSELRCLLREESQSFEGTSLLTAEEQKKRCWRWPVAWKNGRSLPRLESWRSGCAYNRSTVLVLVRCPAAAAASLRPRYELAPLRRAAVLFQCIPCLKSTETYDSAVGVLPHTACSLQKPCSRRGSQREGLAAGSSLAGA